MFVSRLASAAIAVALLVPLDTAAASRLSFDGRLVYVASAGERNLAEFHEIPAMLGYPAVLRINDDVAIELGAGTSSAGCVREAASVILCDPHPVVATLGDMDDEGNGWDGSQAIDGGPGNDAIWGGPGDDVLTGGPGDDQLEAERNLGFGRSGESVGRDVISGGPGNDALGYQSRVDGVTVTLDGQANDGAPGEGDSVASDIERITGGFGADTLIGDGAPNVLVGGPGRDLVVGGDGDDDLDGDAGNDQLRGEGGNDLLDGSSDSDVLDGGAGADTFVGDPPTCTIFECSGGDDVFHARDGQVDTLTCGIGADRAIVDADDTLRDGCEIVDRPARPEPVTNPIVDPPPPRAAPTVRFPATLRPRGFLRGIMLAVTCPEACTIRAVLSVDRRTARRYRLGRRATRIGAVSGRLAAPGSTRLRLRPTSAARRRLARARRLTAIAVVTARAPDGRTQQRRVEVRVR